MEKETFLSRKVIMYSDLVRNKHGYVYERGIRIGENIVHGVDKSNYIQIAIGFKMRSQARKAVNRLNKHFHRQLFRVECKQVGYGVSFFVVHDTENKVLNIFQKIIQRRYEWMAGYDSHISDYFSDGI